MVNFGPDTGALGTIGAVATMTSGTKPLARRTRDERRGIIIDRAAKLFEARGYAGTSMRDIAEDLGVAKAAVYYYFSSKQDLLYAIHETFLTDMSEQAERFLNETGDPREQLRFFVHSIIETVASYQPYVKVFFQELNALDAEHRAAVVAIRDQYESFVEQAIERGIAEGVFNPGVSPRIAALFLFGACNWTYQWLGASGPIKPVQLANAFFELIMAGFEGAGSASSSPPEPAAP
jgi:AcrR family transcriptional regulator